MVSSPAVRWSTDTQRGRDGGWRTIRHDDIIRRLHGPLAASGSTDYDAEVIDSREPARGCELVALTLLGLEAAAGVGAHSTVERQRDCLRSGIGRASHNRLRL